MNTLKKNKKKKATLHHKNNTIIQIKVTSLKAHTSGQEVSGCMYVYTLLYILEKGKEKPQQPKLIES